MVGRNFWWVVVFVAALPGCSLHWNLQTDEKPVTPSIEKANVPVTHQEKFGELISAPGQRVPIGDTPAPLTGPIPTESPKPIIPVAPNAIEVPKQAGPAETAKVDAPPASIFPQPHGPDSPFMAATRAFEQGRSEFANEQLRWFPPVNQAILAKLLPAAARTAAGSIQDPKDATDLVRRIDSAADVVRPFAELRIETVRLCDRVSDFGDYTPSTSLHPGKHVVLYYEVENVVPEQLITGSEVKYFVGFRAKVRIRGNGKTQEISGTYQRQTLRSIRDVYAGIKIEMPSQPGSYTLELELLDAPGRRASRSIDFRVDERK